MHVGVGAILVACISVPAVCWSQTEAFEQWWNEQAAFAQRDALRGRMVKWTVEYPAPTTAQIAAMRQQVVGKPDHPLRATLREIDEQSRAQNPPLQSRLWTSRDGRRSRLASDMAGRPERQTDVALHDDESWTLVTLTLTARRRTSPDVSRDTTVLMKPFEDEAMLALSGGLAAALGYGVDISTTPVSSEPGRFQGVWRKETPHGATRAVITGTFDTQQQRGRIERVEITLSEPGQPERTIRYVVDMTDRPVGSEATAARIEHYRSSGELIRVISLVAAENVTEEAVNALTAMPEVNGVDPIRGPLTFTAIADERPVAEVRTT